MRKIFLFFILMLSPIAWADDLLFEWSDGIKQKNQIKVSEGEIFYSGLKHNTEKKKVNDCAKKVTDYWEKRFNRFAKKKKCKSPLKTSLQIFIDNGVTKKMIDKCQGPLPRYSQVIGEILKCY